MYFKNIRSFSLYKIICGLGSLLAAIGSLSLFSGSVGIVGIIGLILVLISIRGFSEQYNSYAMYRTALLGFFCGVIGTIIAVIVFAALDFFAVIFFAHPVVSVVGILGTLIAWAVMFLFLLASGILFKFTFSMLASTSRQNLLRIGSTLLLIGAATTIIVIGFVLLFVAWFILAVGFFTMKSPTIYIPPYSHASSRQAIYCFHCGSPNRFDAEYCVRCGRKMVL